VTWTAATDDVKVTGYLVDRCSGASCNSFAQVATPGATAVSYVNTGLTPATSYSYRLRAKDAANNISNYSAIASATTLPDTQAPTVPAGLTLTVASNTRINLAWTASTDDVQVTGYRVERCQGVGCTSFAQIATPTGVSYANTGLIAGSSYSYRILATDAAGNLSGYSAIATAVTTGADATLPSVPIGLTATPVSGTQINLTWTASTDNMSVTGYRVERCQGSSSCTTFAQIATPTTPSFNDTGRSPSTIYRYRVRAIDSANLLSGYSTIVNATTSSGVVDCD
jgi:fibronectin type 3 domain-containing protein